MEAQGLIAGARWLHISGVTVALSDSARSAAFTAISVARECGTLVSVAVNHRRKLSPTSQGLDNLRALVAQADLTFASSGEACSLAETDSAGAAARLLVEGGGGDVVVTLGSEGALVAVRDGGEFHQPGYPVVALDSVGAGDAFAAGYLAATLRDLPLERRLLVGNACGAAATSVIGDVAGLLTWPEMTEVLDSGEDIR